MKVPVGLGTIVGYALTTLAAAATAWAAAEGSASHLSPGLLAVLTVVAGSLTNLGRMYQAKTPEEAPADALAPGTSVHAVTPPELVPKDGVDSATVTRSGA